jgi:3-oxoacyl-[acyl-carrier-protein] synthase-1
MYLIGTGMVTPVGSSAASSCAALRAKVSGFSEVPYTDISNEPVVGAPVTFVASNAKGLVRLVDLAAPALQECASFLPSGEMAKTPVLLVIADAARPSVSKRPSDLLVALEARLGVSFAPGSSVFPHGAVGGVIALRHARALIEERKAHNCIVGGVDSFLDQRQLRWLERSRRLKRPNQPFGLIPGEGAGFVVLSATPVDGHARVSVIGIGAAHTAPEDRSRPRAGEIVDAMRAAVTAAGISTSDIGFEITDLTGEREMAVDHALAVTRTFIEPQPKLHSWHMAMSLGSVGAASVPCALAWTMQSNMRGYAPSAHAMCVAISEVSTKGAIVVALQGR